MFWITQFLLYAIDWFTSVSTQTAAKATYKHIGYGIHILNFTSDIIVITQPIVDDVTKGTKLKF